MKKKRKRKRKKEEDKQEEKQKQKQKEEEEEKEKEKEGKQSKEEKGEKHETFPMIFFLIIGLSTEKLVNFFFSISDINIFILNFSHF